MEVIRVSIVSRFVFSLYAQCFNAGDHPRYAVRGEKNEYLSLSLGSSRISLVCMFYLERIPPLKVVSEVEPKSF